MKSIFNILILIGLASFFTSCQPEIELAPKSGKFNMVDGRIAFDSEEDALNTLTVLAKMDENALSNWEKSNNARSFRSVMNVHSTAPEDTTFAFYSPGLAAILNVNQEYQAGDSIIWFHGNYVFKLHKSDIQLLSDVVQNPEDSRFSKFRHIFQSRRQPIRSTGRMVMPGRDEAAILDELAQTPPFKLNGTLDYRFRWDLMSQYSGVSYQKLFVVCLQYRANNGGWYLAGEYASEKRISAAGFVPQSGWYLPYTIVSTSAVLLNNNGYLNMTLVSSSSASEFRGEIHATFKGTVTGTAGTFTFTQQVQWM